MADQFQLLLSTHIFVSMISSAVCNAVCALNDSALEALVRKAVSAQTEFYPLKKCSKHPPLFHLVGASYCILHHQLGLGLICCRATVYMGKSCYVASLSTAFLHIVLSVHTAAVESLAVFRTTQLGSGS